MGIKRIGTWFIGVQVGSIPVEILRDLPTLSCEHYVLCLIILQGGTYNDEFMIYGRLEWKAQSHGGIRYSAKIILELYRMFYGDIITDQESIGVIKFQVTVIREEEFNVNSFKD